MPPTTQRPRWARFGNIELDVQAGELHSSGRRTRLQNQPHQLLVLLLEHAGELVTQDAIRARLWPSDTVVEFELSIVTAVKKLRHALGDEAAAPRYLETLPRRGYRWLLPVIWADASAAADAIGGFRQIPGPKRAAAAIAGAAHNRLAGRASSLDALHESFRRVLRHERQLVFVTGEPGIGKTAVVDEFQHQVAPTLRGRIARGQCVERYGSQEPYYPLLEAVGQLCRGSGGTPSSNSSLRRRRLGWCSFPPS